MKSLFVAFILCLALSASAQPAEEGAVARLVRLRSPAAALEGLTRAQLRAALGSVAGPHETRLALWLDDGTWIAGTSQAEKQAAVKAILRHGRLKDALLRASHDLVPEPTGESPSDFERMLGVTDDTEAARQSWREQTGALQATLAPALGERVQTGTWPPWITTEQRTALQRHLSRVDALEVARHLGGPPPGPANPRAPGAGTDDTDCQRRTPDESACGRHSHPDRTARGSAGGGYP